VCHRCPAAQAIDSLRSVEAKASSCLPTDVWRVSVDRVKDFKNITKPVTVFTSPDMPESTELGRGSIDLKPIVEAGLKAGVKHFFVEQEPPFKEVPAMEAAEIDYRALKSLLG
jgi:hypothetical protein